MLLKQVSSLTLLIPWFVLAVWMQTKLVLDALEGCTLWKATANSSSVWGQEKVCSECVTLPLSEI